MTSNSDAYCVVLTTIGSEQDATTLASSILAARLAACVQIQNIRSLYTWKGKPCSEQECLLLIKTSTALYPQLEAHIKANHKYETPEIILLPILAGSSEYLAWIDTSLSSSLQ